MRRRWWWLAALVGSAACAPALDWREVRPEGSALSALFPCRPASHARQVMLAGVSTRLTMFACSAAGATWAVSFGDVQDPAKLAAVLAEMRASAAANVAAAQSRAVPGLIAGATPNAQAGRVALTGRYPDGKAVQMQVAVFAKGTVAMQASAIGEHLDADALETFYSSLRLPQ